MGSRSSNRSTSKRTSSSRRGGGYHPDLRKQRQRDARNYNNLIGSRFRARGKVTTTGRPW